MLMVMRRPWQQYVLVALLAFTQQMGVAHLTAHAAERLRDHQGTTQTDEGSCAKCAAYASFGSSPPASFQSLARAPEQGARLIAPATAAVLRTVAVYQSRAPPIAL
jgi:hypothetical protein